MFPALLTTVLFSISAVCANRSTRILGSIPANFWRLLLATCLLGLYAHSFSLGMGGPAFPIFFVSGIVGFGVGDFALYKAFPRLGSRLSVLLVNCLAAPIGAIMEWVWLGTPLSSGQILCGLVVLVGVTLALAPGEHLQLSRWALTGGILLCVIAASGQSLGAVLSRKAFEVARQAGENIDGATSAYQRIVGGMLVALIVYTFSKLAKRNLGAKPCDQATPKSDHSTSKLQELLSRISPWGWVTLNAVAGAVLGVSCLQIALTTIPTGVVLPIVAVTPIVVIPFSFVMEGERPTPRSLAGGLIAVAGVVGLSLVTKRAG